MEAEPQKAPRQIPLDTQREPRGPVQRADGAEAVQSERAPPGAPQHPGRLGPQGPSPRADVAEQGGWGCDARCPHWSPEHAHSVATQMRLGAGSARPGRTPAHRPDPRPPPGPPPGVSTGPLQKSLQVGGGGGQYIQKTKPREQTPPLCSPPPTRARLPGWDQPPARAQSPSKQPREQQSQACRPAGCPRPEALALYPRVHLSPTQPFGSCAYSNHDTATTPQLPSARRE